MCGCGLLRADVRTLILLGILAAWTAGCGLVGEANGPRDFAPRSEVVLQPEEGLEGAVRVDSVAWLPVFVEFEYDIAPQELEGNFAARFANLTDLRLQVRYDLRFYDRDGILIDDFIPFGQPVVLEPRQVRWVDGFFLLRADDPRDLEWVDTMQLVARVMRVME